MGYEAGVLKSNRGSDGVVETTVERREGRVSLMNQTCHTPKTRPSRVTDSEGGCWIGALGRFEYQDGHDEREVAWEEELLYCVQPQERSPLSWTR